jgi:hypothetical protein
MARYAVTHGGRVTGRFSDLDQATAKAREIAEAGQLAAVVRRRLLRPPELVTILPEHRAEEGRRLWSARHVGFGETNPLHPTQL